MKTYDLVVKCKAQPMLHAKILRIAGKDREYAEVLAALLDGTSDYYVLKVGDLSPIGKCATCGAPIECEIREFKANKTKYWRNPGALADAKIEQ